MRKIPMFHDRGGSQYIYNYQKVDKLKEISEKHIHNNLELIRVTKGSLEVCVNEITYIIEQGNIICIEAHIPHRLKSCDFNVEYDFMRFKKNSVLTNDNARYSRYFDNFIVHEKHPCFILKVDTEINAEISYYMDKMKKRKSMESEYNDFFMMEYINLIKGTLFECNMLRKTDLPIKYEKKIMDVVEYIDSNFYKDISLDILSDVVGYNKHYICHLFKKITKQGVFDYLTYVRISAAEILLKNNAYSISQISEMVGFKSLSGFDKAFRKLNDCTSSKFRKS